MSRYIIVIVVVAIWCALFFCAEVSMIQSAFTFTCKYWDKEFRIVRIIFYSEEKSLLVLSCPSPPIVKSRNIALMQ